VLILELEPKEPMRITVMGVIEGRASALALIEPVHIRERAIPMSDAL
jgi:hypothetical protein